MIYEEHFIESGRNIIFYQDKNHNDRSVQDQLTERITDDICHRKITHLFYEDIRGHVPLKKQFSESSLRETIPNISATFLLVNRFFEYIKKGQITMSGVEDRDLKNRGIELLDQIEATRIEYINHRKCLDRFKEECAPKLAEGMTPEYMQGYFTVLDEATRHNQTLCQRLKDIWNEAGPIQDQRSDFSAQLVIRLMEQDDLKIAGVLYGSGHYKRMIDQFTRHGFGYATFIPDAPKREIEDWNDLFK